MRHRRHILERGFLLRFHDRNRARGIAALRAGREEVVVGDIAKEIHAKWAEDPGLFRQEQP